jgi:hypothetical protein
MSSDDIRKTITLLERIESHEDNQELKKEYESRARQTLSQSGLTVVDFKNYEVLFGSGRNIKGIYHYIYGTPNGHIIGVNANMTNGKGYFYFTVIDPKTGTEGRRGLGPLSKDFDLPMVLQKRS